MRPATGTIVKPLPAHLFTLHGVSAEMRWEAMAGQGYHTPTDRFFVRNHTSTPRIDRATWRLRLHGGGLRCHLEIGYDQLRAMPYRVRDVALECAGNGRRFYDTQQREPAPGMQWGLGAVGVARWKGVPLRHLLELAGLRAGAVDVLATGLDEPFVHEGANLGHVRRPLPLEKALDDVLVAYEMNGEPLPPDHGFPARLVVPGWAGIASVKWLGDLEVSTTELFTPWNTLFYPGVTTMTVKSAFELPWPAILKAGVRHVLHGRSWSGTGPIHHVEVSSDNGLTWHLAERRGLSGDAWLPWRIVWTPREEGPHTLLARAVDDTGASQPERSARHPFGYHFDAVVRHPVLVTRG
ncbi:sulfite oxidase [Nonomuraea sp. NPDC059194]|uniref:sulfite oxidase n=1 Tax=Nonomuraea sp. NPDC059194 TaxID=3346764 RepID=UPI0036C75D8A